MTSSLAPIKDFMHGDVGTTPSINTGCEAGRFPCAISAGVAP